MVRELPESNRDKIIAYMRERVKDKGRVYFKAKHAAKDIGLSANVIGTTMGKLAQGKIEGLKISCGGITTGITWKVESV